MKNPFQRCASLLANSLRLPLYAVIIIEIISGLQIVYILSTITFESIISNDESRFADFFRHVTSVSGGFDFIDAPTSIRKVLWVIIAAYLLVNILMFVILLFWKQVYQGKRNSWKNIATVYLVHSRVIFFPVQLFLFKLIKSYTDCDEMENTNFYCGNVWTVLTILLTTYNFGLAALVEVRMYQVNKVKNKYSSKGNTINKMLLLHKNIMVILYLLIASPEAMARICAAVSVVFAIGYVFILFTKLPYYNLTVLKISTIMIGAIVSLTFILTWRVFFEDTKMLEILVLTLTILFIWMFVRLLNITLKKILNEKWGTPEKAIHFAMLLKLNALKAEPLSAFRRRFTEEAIISRGCLVNQNVDLSEVSQGSKSDKIELELYNYIYEKLNIALDKNPKSVLLLLFMAKISLKKLGNLPQAVSLAKRAEVLCQTTPLKNSFDNFNMGLNSFYSHQLLSTDSKINIVNYFNFRKIANKLQSEVKADIDQYLDFWKRVKKRDVDVGKMIDLVQEIDKASFRIERIFQAYSDNFNKHFRPILLVYEIYLDVSQKIPVKNRKFIDKFLSLTHTHTSHTFDAYSEEVAVVITSLEKNATDIIIEASGSVQNLFQVTKNELVGKSVSVLFPSLFGKQHIQMIKEYIESPENRLNSNYKGYCKTQDNNIFEADVQIQFYPSFEHGIRLMTVFRKPEITNSIIVVGHSGNIIECNETLRKHLNIERKLLENAKMQSICPNFDIINSSFNTAYQQYADYLPRKETLALHKTFTSPGVKDGDLNSEGELVDNKKVQRLLSREDEDKGLLASPIGRVTTEGLYGQQDTSYFPLASPDRLLTTLASPKSPHISKIPVGDMKPKYDKICEEFLNGNKLIIIAQGKEPGEELQLEYNAQIEPYLLNGNIYKVLKLNNGEIVAKPPEIPATTRLVIPNEKRSALAVDMDKLSGRPVSIEIHFQENEGKSLGKGLTLPTGTKLSAIQLHQSTSKILDDNSEPTPILRNNRRKITVKGPAKKFEPGEQQMSVAASSIAGQARSYKESRNLLDSKKSYFVSRKFLGVIYFVILALMSLATINFFLSKSSIHRVRQDMNIINLTNQRLAEAVRAFHPLVRVYLRVMQIIPMAQMDSIKVTLFQKKNAMLERNNELRKRLADLAGDKYHRLFYTDDIRLWRFSEQDTMVSDLMDTFTATNILANAMQSIANYTGDMKQFANKPEIIFPLNNTINDYLVSSENTILELQDLLRLTINDSLTNFRIIIAFASLSIVIIMVAWIILARKILHSYEFLLRTLLSIREQTIDSRISQIESMKRFLEYDIETRELVSNMINFFDIEEIKEKAKQAKTTKMKRQEEKFKMFGVSVKLFKQIVINIVAIGIIIAVFIASLIQSTNDFEQLYRASVQLSVTNKAEYEVSLLVSNFYYLVIFQNDNRIFFRNQPPSQQLNYNYKIVNDLNENIINAFFEEGVGIADPIVNELLNTKVCEFLPNSSVPLCLQALKNQKVGVLTINANLLLATMYYLDKYHQNPTWSNAGSFITSFGSIARPSLETLEAAYNFLNRRILSKADERVDNFIHNKTVIIFVILGIVIFYTLITQLMTVRQFRKVDMGRGQTLKVIPYQMFQESKALKFYIRREFSKSRALLKHFS